MKRRTFLTHMGHAAAGGLLLPALRLPPSFRRSAPPPDDTLLDSLLQEALAQGAEYADARLVRSIRQSVQLQNQTVSNVVESDNTGLNLRMFIRGRAAWIATDDLSGINAREIVSRAIEWARTLPAQDGLQPPGATIRLTWHTPMDIDPFSVPLKEKIDFLKFLTSRVSAEPDIEFTVANLFLVRREQLLVSTSGARVETTTVCTYPNFAVTAVARKKAIMESRPSFNEPMGVGYEITAAHPFAEEIKQAADEAREKLAAPPVSRGPYTLVIAPSHLWFILDETFGHHLDPDNILGYEENNAREHPFRIDGIGREMVASAKVTIIADNTLERGLATSPTDDEGRPSSRMPLIEQGRLVGLPVDALHRSAVAGVENPSAAYSENWNTPLNVRIPNLVLEADPAGRSLSQMVAGTERGLLLRGKGGIAHHYDRQAFLAAPALAWLIENGELTGMVRKVTYQSRMQDFWNSCAEVGLAGEAALGGAFLAEKGDPPRRIPHSVLCPPAVFPGIHVQPSQGN